MRKQYSIEREGQMDFFDNYSIDYENDNSILIDNTDGVYNGNLLEFKTDIVNISKTLFQAIKYLSRMRVKGESVPRIILLVDLNKTTVYVYHSDDYKDDIQKIYIGASSRGNDSFAKSAAPIETLDYSSEVDSSRLKKLLKKDKTEAEKYLPIDIDENCIVGWAERYYRENPKASKGDFLGDDTGVSVKIIGEIRDPKHFKGLINPYTGKTNERFKYLMGRLNDRLNKKDLGAFYTPTVYCKKAAELVLQAVDRVPEGNDYIILDRCAGTGNLEAALIGLTDKNGDELISHCVVSTYEYYEYKVLQERIGDLVRESIPPTEKDVEFQQGKISNADAMSEDFLNDPIIKKYVDNPQCTIILYENPPYTDSSASTFNVDGDKTKKAISTRKSSYIASEFKKHISEFNTKQSSARELLNLFVWAAFNKGYLRQPTDSYVVFGHVNYYKNVHVVKKRFLDGYAFNQKHFDASDSVITVILWANIDEDNLNFSLPIYDIQENRCVPVLNKDGSIKSIAIRKCIKSINELGNVYDKSLGVLTSVVCGSDGYPIIGYSYKSGRKPIYDESVIGYMRTTNLKIDAMNYALVRCNLRTGLEQCYGRHILRSNYLFQLPLFTAKLYPETEWWEKDVYSTTSDGGDAYTRDEVLLKECLIYTCLSNQNKCLSFHGSDGRYYRNELCFDTTHGDTCASADLRKFAGTQNTVLDEDERELMRLWEMILAEAKKTANYNTFLTYGVYQITKELNTFHEEGTGKNKKNIPDYNELNGYLVSLRNKLKEYYKSHISEKLFQYELLK